MSNKDGLGPHTSKLPVEPWNGKVPLTTNDRLSIVVYAWRHAKEADVYVVDKASRRTVRHVTIEQTVDEVQPRPVGREWVIVGKVHPAPNPRPPGDPELPKMLGNVGKAMQSVSPDAKPVDAEGLKSAVKSASMIVVVEGIGDPGSLGVVSFDGTLRSSHIKVTGNLAKDIASGAGVNLPSIAAGDTGIIKMARHGHAPIPGGGVPKHLAECLAIASRALGS